MNNDQKLGNMSEGEYRDLEAAPLQNTENDAAEIPTALNDDAMENSIDREILNADLDDMAPPLDTDAKLTTGEGFTEVLESDLNADLSEGGPAYGHIHVPDTLANAELSDGGPSYGHIHVPEMIASDTPGEIDIEDMEENDLQGTGIPADALLDPLED